MSYKCVVGNCLQPEEDVKRCWNGWDSAYLDLCWYHREVLASRHIDTYVQGWDHQ